MVCLPTCFHWTRNATRESTHGATTMNPGSARPCDITVKGSKLLSNHSGQSLMDLFNSAEDFLTHSFSSIQAVLIVNRAAMGWARFMVYLWFFFVDLSATRPKLPPGQILSHVTCDVYLPKAVETLINLISNTDFRRKKLKTQRSSKIIFFHQKFSLEHIHIYIRLNRRWNDLFRIFFPSGSTKTSDYKITPNPHFAKNLFKTLTSKQYNTSALIATTHQQAVNLFLNNPALSC